MSWTLRRLTLPRVKPIVTLTTDFGVRDWFVGVMKGVILDRAPATRIVDLTHEIPPGDVRAAAFVLRSSLPYFPAGTVHVVVVDPGVGSDRHALGIRTGGAFLLGPDNGVLSWALPKGAGWEARQLTNRRLWRSSPSATFHGRDIFAPVAGFLAKGGRFERIGQEVTHWLRLPWREPQAKRGRWHGEVVYVDRFGNAITNLPGGVASDIGGAETRLWIEYAPRRRCRLSPCYAAVPPGEPLAVVGSTGFLELAVNGGHAADQLGLRVGSPVLLGCDRTPVRRR